MKHKQLLQQVNKTLEERANKKAENRTYLGASSIGHECTRYLWLSFRKAFLNHIDAASEKRFADGHYSEDVVARRMIESGIELQTVDPDTGRQFAISDCGGWFRGHKDGIIENWAHDVDVNGEDYIWEHKCSEKSSKALKLCEQDEHTALKKWNEIYYDQAQTYMHHSGIHKHLTTISPPGSRDKGEVVIETLYDKKEYERIKQKAESIITSDRMPQGVCYNETDYRTRFCSAANVCFGNYVHRPTCNNCAYVTFHTDGDRKATCGKFNNQFQSPEQMMGSYPCHRYNPDLIRFAEVIAHSDGEVTYRDEKGRDFVNGEGKGAFTSEEIHFTSTGEGGIIYDDVIAALKDKFDARIDGKFENKG